MNGEQGNRGLRDYLALKSIVICVPLCFRCNTHTHTHTHRDMTEYHTLAHTLRVKLRVKNKEKLQRLAHSTQCDIIIIKKDSKSL